MKTSLCPKCKTKFQFDPSQPTVTCPACGKSFRLGKKSASAAAASTADPFADSGSSGFDGLDAALASQPTDAITRSKQRMAKSRAKSPKASKQKVKLVTPQRKIAELSAKPTKGPAKYLPWAIAGFLFTLIAFIAVFSFFGRMNKPKEKELVQSEGYKLLRKGLSPQHIRPGDSDVNVGPDPGPPEEFEAPFFDTEDLVGKWELDIGETLRVSRKSLTGKIKDVEGYLLTIYQQELDFEFKDDDTFVCIQVNGGPPETYSGVYSIDGSTVKVDQTHHGNEPEKDKLRGKFQPDGKLLLNHLENNLVIPYVLSRVREIEEDAL